jgi:hypothetical protein
MTLNSATCSKCGELHLVRADGQMSIHATANGARCAPEPRREQPRPARGTGASSRPEAHRADIDPELAAAFEEAALRRKPSQRDREPGLDRRIYAVKGARPVRGGLPTLGRGRRN